MATKIIAAIPKAMDELVQLRDYYSGYEDLVYLRLLMHKLRGLRTFLLCLRRLEAAKVTSFTFPNVEERHRSVLRVEDGMEESQLESLLKRLECFVETILKSANVDFLFGIETFEEEIDQWYACLSDYLPLASNPPVACDVEDIFNSVIENLEDFLSLHIAYVGVVVAPVEALKGNITFWRNFLRFATFLGIDQQQEFPDLLTNMEALAFSAAHFTLHIFSARHYNINVFSEAERNLRANHEGGSVLRGSESEVFWRNDALHSPHSYETSYDRLKSTVSTLLLKINPLHNPHLYESYTRALESMRCSREYYVSKLDIQGSSALLLSSLWEALQFHTGPVATFKYELQKMYEGLRNLRALLKKHPNRFDGAVGAIARAGIFDAGVIMYSVYQNINAIDHEVEDFLGRIKLIQTEVEEQVVSTSRFNFPKTTVLAFLDFLLNYLMEVESSHVDSDAANCVRRVEEHLLLLRSIMEKLVKLKKQQENLHHAVWKSAIEVAYKIELLIDQLVLGNLRDSDLMSLQSITQDMKNIKTDFEKIFDVRTEELDVPLEVTWTDSSIPSAHEFVGFEAEQKEIMDRLTRGSSKLHVVVIVGMPGLGKTTLATKVYNQPSVQQHFHVRAWCSISQEFNKKKVLLELLNQIVQVSKSDYDLTEDELAQKLRRSLLRRRYLIYIDDVWEIEAFESLRLAFPGDSFGRILLTSRIGDVAKLDDQPHFLRQFTFSESLELLRRKVSPNKGLSQSLHDIAVKIAENCKGLPLIITIAAGLLATTKQEVWEEVLKSLTSGIISSTDQCERTMELSYKHLPEHLKPCLLLFGAFPEDEEISVKRLIWLWIAEGFVKQTNSRSIEEVAADYLKDLIGRSLVMNSQKSNGGGIKTCCIHDLLLDFCLRKANEENYLHLLNGREEMLHFEESCNVRRLCVHSNMGDFVGSKLFYPRLRSLSFFGDKWCNEVTDISFIFRIFKLLRVLNMENVRIAYDFPGGVGVLVHLRYLAISVNSDVSPSIGYLSQLETFILLPVCEVLVTMPDTFWNLRKLRHLLLKCKHNLHGIILPMDNSCNFLEIESLSGLHSQDWRSMGNHLRNFPNISRLKCSLYEFENDRVDGSKVMSFCFLRRLQSLTLSFRLNFVEFEFSFLPNMKKLHLSGCNLSWERISKIAQLPNLEVLKLLDRCFIGDRWQMEEGEFSKLRILKLKSLDIINWTGCDDQFPNLEKLVVEECDELEEIPECLENVDSLEMIEVKTFSDRVAGLFETVADYLKDRGNSVLQLHVYPTRIVDEDEDSANEEEEDLVNA